MFKHPDKSGNCKLCGTWRPVLCRDRIIPKREGGTYTPENIQRICANCHQDKTAKEQSAAHKGRPKTPEQRAKMSAWQVGKVIPQATREKIRQSVLKTMANPELRKYLSEQQRINWPVGAGPFRGKKHSDKTKAKISASLKALPRPQKDKQPWLKFGMTKSAYKLLGETKIQREKRLEVKRRWFDRYRERERARMKKRYYNLKQSETQ